MKYNDFTEELRNEIAETIKTQLLKKGIDVDITIKVRKDKNGNIECISAVSSTFQTTPVIYKEIKVSGSAKFVAVDGHEGVFDLDFYLDYRFEYFSKAYNGVKLGVIRLRYFEKDNSFMPVSFEI